jgi:cytochrome P450
MAQSGTPPRVLIGANDADRARNLATGAGLVDDPYSKYAELRETGPVHEGTISAAFGLEGPEGQSWRDRRQFACYDWETVDTVLRDNHTYSSEWYVPTLRPVVGRSIIEMDEPEHRRYRSLVQPAFTRMEIEGWRKRWIQPAVDEIVAGFLARGGPVDLYAELCARVPVYTIARSFGIAAQDVSHFHELAITSVGVVTDPALRIRAADEIADYLRRVIAERRRSPSDDLISVLCTVELEDPETGKRERLDDEEILAFARIMLPAGAGTTYRGLGCLFLGLLQTGQLEKLRANRGLLDAAIEESLRWEQPLTSIGRLCTRDTELAGVKIPAGSAMHASVAAANRDPARWEDPDHFDIERPLRPHASFGSGPHLCIGMHLARTEMRTAINAVLDRLPGLRLDPDADEPWITGLLFRTPTAVPVVFDAP